MIKRNYCRRLLLGAGICALLAAGCTRSPEETVPAEEPVTAAEEPASPSDGVKHGDFREFVNTYTAMRDTIFSGTPGLARTPETLGQYSLKALTDRTAAFREMKKQLSFFNTAQMDSGELIAFRRMEYILGTELKADGLELYAQPLSPECGIQIQIPAMLSAFRFENTSDVDHYLSLMNEMAPLYENILAFEQEKANAGLLTGGEPLELMIRSLDPYMVRANNNILSRQFAEKLNAVPGLTEAKRQEYLEAHQTALKESFIPAYRTLSQGLEELQEAAAATGGLASMPEGKAYYRYLIASGSGSGESILALCQKTEQRIDRELDQMTALLDQYPELSGESDDLPFAFDTDEGALAWLEDSIAGQFPSVTMQEMPASEASSVDVLMAGDAAEEDSITSAEKPFVSRRRDSGTDDPDLTGIAGRGIPGLAYRRQYYREHTVDPRLSRSPSAKEQTIDPLVLAAADPGSALGWELYASQYAFAEGNGLSDELNEFMRAYTDATAGLYALMDMHLNYDGWSAEQFEDFCRAYGFSDEEVIAELRSKFLASPSFYACRYISYMTLMELREEAAAVLGSRFSSLDFHQFLLDMGPVNCQLLEPYFRAWLLTRNH